MQNIFSKIDKKILIIIGVILIIVLIAAFFVYKYSKDVGKTVQNKEGEVEIKTSGEQIITPSENTQNQNQPKGTLTVCADKCGDGICQPAGTICEDNLNCVCAETKINCSQDCN